MSSENNSKKSGSQYSSGAANARKQTSRTKNYNYNKYNKTNKQGNSKNQEKFSKPAFKPVVKNPIKNAGRRGRKSLSKLKVIPLGGLEQIGMNITAFEYEDSIVVVDCGLSFPEDDMLGIDLVIPDVTYLK